ncbi:hypothetical protein D3C72_421870 [compost metagenome]
MTEQKMRGTISICMVFTNRTPMGLSSIACSLKQSPSPIPVSMPSSVFNQSGRRVQIRQGLKTNPWNSMTPMSLFSVCDGKGGASVAIPRSGCHIIDKATLAASPGKLKKAFCWLISRSGAGVQALMDI